MSCWETLVRLKILKRMRNKILFYAFGFIPIYIHFLQAHVSQFPAIFLCFLLKITETEDKFLVRFFQCILWIDADMAGIVFL